MTSGIVEIFDVYDHRYFEIFVDGAHALTVEKNHFMVELGKTKIRKKIAQMAGTAPSRLRYTLWLLETAGYSDPEYDANVFSGDYQACVDYASEWKAKTMFQNADLKYLESLNY